jgi:hypothetical protein
MTEPARAHAELLVYRFGADADFEGRLAGALERIETGGALRILDALFVARDAKTAELSAVALRGDGAGGIAGPLIGFRLDPAERRRTTERTLRRGSTGVPPETMNALGRRLERGEAIAAVLVEHRWARALDDAVGRTGGTQLLDEFVDATSIGELADAAGQLFHPIPTMPSGPP